MYGYHGEKLQVNHLPLALEGLWQVDMDKVLICYVMF